jgi:hypothetical protein
MGWRAVIPDEPPFRSNRTDAESYAEEALESLLQGIALDERQQGYIREMLVSAFEDGETQGEFRALWVLAIAHRNAQSPATKAALVEVVQLLAPDVAATWEET